MDSADFAQQLEEQQRAEALARMSVKPGKGPALWYCEDCLAAIPELRRRVMPGCTRCVSCQHRAEGGGRG